MDSIYLKDDFVNVKAGEGFRLFPFGVIYKGGKRREITPEFARTIKLPHFKPAIKLSSHEDNAPAGGFIIGLEVRDDGLYALPEWNEAGQRAIQEGAYRYNSPEIIWSGALENPIDGSAINAPLILATALLHTPHLGEAAALYSVEAIDTHKENDMNENMTIPTAIWEKYIAPLFAKAEPEKVEVKVEVVPEDYETAKTERDQYKALIETQKAEATKAAAISKFETELKETKADPTLAALLADITPEAADAIVKQLKALSAQIDDSTIEGEKGTEGQAIDDPKAAFNAAVLAISKEKGIQYNAAFEEAKATHADLFKAAFAK